MTIQTLYLQYNQSSKRAHYQTPSLVKRERVSPSTAQQMVFPFPPSYGYLVVPYSWLPSTHASTWTRNYYWESLFVPISPRHCQALLPSANSGIQTLEITAAGGIMGPGCQLCWHRHSDLLSTRVRENRPKKQPLVQPHQNFSMIPLGSGIWYLRH